MSTRAFKAAAQTKGKLHKLPRLREAGSHYANSSSSGEEGFTLIETVFAVAILIIAVVGVMSLFGTTFKMNRWQGDPSTRTIEYAQDKMEALLALSFNDWTSDTTVFPTCSTPNCTPINGKGLKDDDSFHSTDDAGTVVAGYVDYLDANGQLLTSSTGAMYRRRWSIKDDTNNHSLKMVTVVAESLSSTTLPVRTKLVCLKTGEN